MSDENITEKDIKKFMERFIGMKILPKKMVDVMEEEAKKQYIRRLRQWTAACETHCQLTSYQLNAIAEYAQSLYQCFNQQYEHAVNCDECKQNLDAKTGKQLLQNKITIETHMKTADAMKRNVDAFSANRMQKWKRISTDECFDVSEMKFDNKKIKEEVISENELTDDEMLLHVEDDQHNDDEHHEDKHVSIKIKKQVKEEMKHESDEEKEDKKDVKIKKQVKKEVKKEMKKETKKEIKKELK